MYALEDVVTDLLGTRFVGHSVNRMFRCEFHDDRTASLSINLDTGLWHCFGCGKRGNIERLATDLGRPIDGDIALRLAVRSAEAAEAPYVPPPLFDQQIHRQHRALVESTTAHVGVPANAWFSFCMGRGIDPAYEETYQVGWEQEKFALTFPYFDSEGRGIGIKYRSPRSGHKWSEPGSRFEFFGPNPTGRDRVVICEGESDTLRVATELRHRDYRTVVVGTSGSPMLAAHWQSLAVRLLFASDVYLLFDADDAGDAAADAAMRVLGDKAHRVRPTQGKDATEHLLNGGTLDEIGLDREDVYV